MYISNIDEININIINNLISDGVLSNYEFEIARNLIEEIKNKAYNYNKFDIDIYNNSMASDLHKSIAFHLEAIKELKNKQYIKASEYLIKEQLLLINMNEYLLLKKNHNLLAYVYYKNENLENAKNIFKNILSYKFLEKRISFFVPTIYY